MEIQEDVQRAKLSQRFLEAGLNVDDYDIAIRRTDRPLCATSTGQARVDYDYVFNNMVFRSIGSIVKYIVKDVVLSPSQGTVKCKICPKCDGRVPNASHKCNTPNCNHDFGIAVPLIGTMASTAAKTHTVSTDMDYDSDIKTMIDDIFKERVCYIFKKKRKQRDDGEWDVTPFQVAEYYRAVMDKAKMEKNKMLKLYSTM